MEIVQGIAVVRAMVAMVVMVRSLLNVIVVGGERLGDGERGWSGEGIAASVR